MKDVDEQLAKVRGKRSIRQDTADSYIEKYLLWSRENDEKDLVYERDVKKQGLDGAYWE